MSTAAVNATHPDSSEPGDPLDSVAIVGMACRFPGAGNIEEFWANLRDGVESISPVSVEEMLDCGVDAAEARHPQHVAVAAVPAGIENCDASFFGCSPKQAQLTDPQQRMLLECAWDAMESAGCDPEAAGGKIGVFAGSSLSTYLMSNLYPSLSTVTCSSDLPILIGNDKDYLATQVAYKLGLTGPAISIQTACSTSLVAVHLACQSLLNHECDVALAGGVTVRLPARGGYRHENGGLLSPDGHCRPFDAAAQGTVFGSGVGLVVVKRLADALADHDVIDAVIKGSAINNDGALKAGYTAPSEDGQAEVIADALAIAGVAPDTIGYVEAHGTGTPIGDPIEVAALTRAFRSRATGPLPPGTCAIGSVKANIGHLEAAAGIAALIKTALMLTRRQIPPTVHYTTPNPAIDFARTPFYVSTSLSEWPARRTPRRAGVSSFGIGGTNAHLVLEQAPEPAARGDEPNLPSTGRPHMLPLSARDPAALTALGRRYDDFLGPGGAGADASLMDVCWSASRRRRHHQEYRLAVTGRSRDELRAQLAAAVGQPGTARCGGRRRLAFVFPGQGSQWAGMGRQLLEREPAFRAAISECDRAIRQHAGWSPLAELTRDDGDASWLERIDRVQLALFAVQVGLAAWWRSIGVAPDAVAGHSLGEIAAAHVAGVLSLDDAVRIVHQRSRLVKQITGQGRMLATGLTAAEAGALLAGHQAQASVAIVNSPRSTVLSGNPEVLKAIAAALRSKGTFHRWVNVDFASHSPQVAPLLDSLRESVRDIAPRAAAVPIVSTVTGGPIDGTALDAGYWARNLRDPVLFADATRWLRDHDHDVFVEISPHPVLLPAVEDSLYHLGRPGTVVPSTRRDSDEQRALAEAVGALYSCGYPVRWDLLCPRPGRYVRLPGYPWQRRRHWVDPPRDQRRPPAAADTPPVHPLLGRRLRSPLKPVQFESDVSLPAVPYLEDHQVCGQVVFPAAGYLEMLARAAAWDGSTRRLTDVVMDDRLTLTSGKPRRIQTVVTPAGSGEATIELFGWHDRAEQWRSYVTARACAPRLDGQPPSLEEARLRCQQDATPAAFYEALRVLGLEYGPRFRGIESLLTGSGEALGQVALPGPLAADGGHYGVHPALLDACLQLAGAALAGNGAGTPYPVAGQTGSVYLPVSVASFCVAVPGQTQVTAHAVVRDAKDTQSRVCDVHVYDRAGRVVAEVLGLELRRVSQAALRAAAQDDLDRWFHELVWQPRQHAACTAPSAGPPPDAHRGHWLILADRGGVGLELAGRIEQRGDTATLVFPADSYTHDAGRAAFGIDPSAPEHFTRMLAAGIGACRGVIHLWSLDTTPEEQTSAASLADDEVLTCGSALHLVQALVRQPWAGESRLWLVTRGAQALTPSAAPPAPAQAPLWGLGRTVCTEHPELPCMLVDLDAGTAEDAARALLAEADAVARCSLEAQGAMENQIAFRDGERFAARLVRSPASTPANRPNTPARRGEAVRLVIPARGALDGLRFEAARRRPPAAGEVEIRVRATGLNFRDVLNALGSYPGDPGPLGLECAGEITAVGEGVAEFLAGDAVVALAQGSFATFVTVPAVLVARKPQSLSYAEAATIPISFMTAHYAVRHLARISGGDTILIHAAAGGMGLAAAQLALRAGAEVYGTAGTESKRSYLRALGLRHVLPSRTLKFAAQVKELTAGRGVDIVLNSLTGDYIPANLSVLAVGGRFLEAGKIGIWDAERVTAARPDITYSVVDLDAAARNDPEAIGRMLRELMGEFERGELRPLPRHIFAMDAASDAFRFMARARHTGKIVITQEVGLSPAAADRFRDDASYLITGGLGGLGLQVARWMTTQGARHLALASRHDPSDEARAVIGELTAAGVQVLVLRTDVADTGQVTRALTEIGSSMPRLRGIVHAAGIVDDGVLLRQDWERFASVLAPKVRGAWNLHAQTRQLPLDFFVLFSSIAAVWGPAGQSSYAAANAYLDSLADARRSQGLPALSIDWGGWSQVGMAARGVAAERMTAHDMQAITPDAGVRALDHAMRQQAAQLVIIPVDWPAFLGRFPADRIPPLLSGLRGEPQPSPAAEEPQGRPVLLERLAAAATGNRRRILAAYLDEQVRLALGLAQQVPLDPVRPLGELGLDSLLAIELRNRLSGAVGSVLPATVLYDYPTIEALAGYLADEVLNLPPCGAAGDHAPAKEDIRQMPADEYDAALTEELAAVQALLNGGRR